MRISLQITLRRRDCIQIRAGLDGKATCRTAIRRQLLLSFLKIAAIATIADSVPLQGENRVIASLGLNALRSAVNPGLKALLEVAQLRWPAAHLGRSCIPNCSPN